MRVMAGNAGDFSSALLEAPANHQSIRLEPVRHIDLFGLGIHRLRRAMALSAKLIHLRSGPGIHLLHIEFRAGRGVLGPIQSVSGAHRIYMAASGSVTRFAAHPVEARF